MRPINFVSYRVLLFALLCILCAACKPPAKVYKLEGSIKINNDCTGKEADLPNQVTVSAALDPSPGDKTAPKGLSEHTVVNVAHDPKAGTNPTKIGLYEITINWTGEKPPAKWVSIDIVGPLGNNICKGISAGSKPFCDDINGKGEEPIQTGGLSTVHNIDVSCRYVP